MKHLVLGSSGQVGYHLVNFLRREDNNYQVITFDIEDSLEEDLTIPNNRVLVDKIQEADFVHFLAFDIGGSSYMEKYQDTFKFISTNSKIMVNTFDLLQKYNKPFIFASSQMSNMSYSTYGLLKAIGEKYTKSLGGLTVKFWNVYGYETNEEKSHVITDFIKMAKKDRIIKMRTDGVELRQFLYGDDCAECLLELSKIHAQLDITRPLHVTSFEWTSILDIANIINEIYPSRIIPGINKDSVQLDKRNEPDPYILDFWKPKTSIRQGIFDLFDKIS